MGLSVASQWRWWSMRLNKIGYSPHGQIETSLMPSPFSNVNRTTLQHCLRHEHYSITLKAVIIKHSAGVKAKHDS